MRCIYEAVSVVKLKVNTLLLLLGQYNLTSRFRVVGFGNALVVLFKLTIFQRSLEFAIPSSMRAFKPMKIASYSPL